jgi:hypothetical protein
MSARDHIKVELGRTPSGTPVPVVASNLMRRIPRDEQAVVFHELLCHAIRQETMAHGNFAALDLKAHHTNGRHLTSVDRAPGKSKWEVTLPAWRKMLNRSQMIDGKVYRLGDMTVDMLRQAATVRRVQAKTMVENAEWYEKVAAALEEHAVAKVDDLPDDVLAPLYEAVAA